jgi:polysaccharide export outer membrane protein
MHNRVLLGLLTAILLATAVHVSAEDGKPAAIPETLPGVGGAETNSQKEASPPALQRRNPRYQLCKGDVLDLNFPISPEFNQAVTVQPDGYITLLGIGDLHVEGQTVPEATKSIRDAYAKTLHDPVISIQLKDFEKPHFVAGGEIGHPGKYELRGDATVTEAIAMAGGFTPAAKHSQVWLFRRVSNDWMEVQKLNLKKMLNAADLREDLHLRPGDMIYVPKNNLSKIQHFLPVASLGMFFNPLP